MASLLEVVAELKQAIAQHKIVASDQQQSPDSVVDPSPTSEPLSEPPAPLSGWDSTRKRQQVSQNANASKGELPSESLLNPPNGESSLISPPKSENTSVVGELTGESLLSPPDGEFNLISSSRSENTSVVGELTGESLLSPPDGESSFTAPLVSENSAGVSELPSDSPATPRDGESSLTAPLVTENTPVLSELPSDSPTSTPISEETLNEPLANEKGNGHVATEMAAQIPKSFTGAALARRLGVSPGSISRNKTKDNFGQWTFQHDPDGVSWHFNGQTFQPQSGSVAPEILS